MGSQVSATDQKLLRRKRLPDSCHKVMKVSFRQNLTPGNREICREEECFSVEQIVAVLKQAEGGVWPSESIRQVGIAEQTLYLWKKPYKGLETDQIRQLKQLNCE